MGKRRKNKGRNRKKNKSEEGNYTRENEIHVSEDDSLEDMDELVEHILDIKYTGTGK